jgi:hypothetical protein
MRQQGSGTVGQWDIGVVMKLIWSMENKKEYTRQEHRHGKNIDKTRDRQDMT